MSNGVWCGTHTVRARIRSRPLITRFSFRRIHSMTRIPGELLHPVRRESPLSGIEQHEYLERHDPSNIIEHDSVYHLWFTEHPPEDGFIGTYVNHATSRNGQHWEMRTHVLADGNPGEWDSKGALTAYVVPEDGRYVMFYTGVGDSYVDSNQDKRGIGYAVAESQVGVAIADTLTGPYVKYHENPLFRGHALSAWAHRSGVSWGVDTLPTKPRQIVRIDCNMVVAK